MPASGRRSWPCRNRSTGKRGGARPSIALVPEGAAMRTMIDPDTGDEFELRLTPEYMAEITAFDGGWCQHPTTELRRRTIASGQITYWHQCQTCGAFPGNAVRKPDDADRIPDADTALKDRYEAQRV